MPSAEVTTGRDCLYFCYGLVTTTAWDGERIYHRTEFKYSVWGGRVQKLCNGFGGDAMHLGDYSVWEGVLNHNIGECKMLPWRNFGHFCLEKIVYHYLADYSVGREFEPSCTMDRAIILEKCLATLL